MDFAVLPRVLDLADLWILLGFVDSVDFSVHENQVFSRPLEVTEQPKYEYYVVLSCNDTRNI